MQEFGIDPVGCRRSRCTPARVQPLGHGIVEHARQQGDVEAADRRHAPGRQRDRHLGVGQGPVLVDVGERGGRVAAPDGIGGVAGDQVRLGGGDVPGVVVPARVHAAIGHPDEQVPLAQVRAQAELDLADHAQAGPGRAVVALDLGQDEMSHAGQGDRAAGGHAAGDDLRRVGQLPLDPRGGHVAQELLQARMVGQGQRPGLDRHGAGNETGAPVGTRQGIVEVIHPAVRHAVQDAREPAAARQGRRVFAAPHPAEGDIGEGVDASFAGAGGAVVDEEVLAQPIRLAAGRTDDRDQPAGGLESGHAALHQSGLGLPVAHGEEGHVVRGLARVAQGGSGGGETAGARDHLLGKAHLLDVGEHQPRLGMLQQARGGGFRRGGECRDLPLDQGQARGKGAARRLGRHPGLRARRGRGRQQGQQQQERKARPPGAGRAGEAGVVGHKVPVIGRRAYRKRERGAMDGQWTWQKDVPSGIGKA